MRAPLAVEVAPYQRVAAAAEAAGYLHHAALARERRAGLLESLGRAEAGTELGRTAELYRAWGADGKLRMLLRLRDAREGADGARER